MADEKRYIITNPNNPVESDLWKDVIQVDANNNPILDESGNIKVVRHVVRGTVGLTNAEVEAKINTLNATLVHTSGNETVAGIKSFTSSPMVPTATDGDASTKAANTNFVKKATDSLQSSISTQITNSIGSATNSLRTELSAQIDEVAEKSNAISVSTTDVENVEASTGYLTPAHDLLTNPEPTEALDSIFKAYANVCEIRMSLVPLTDSALHLCDGAVLPVDGVYEEGIAEILAKKATNPTLFTTELDWQTQVSTYGVCGKFVHDETNDTLRLPKISGFLEGTLTDTELGNLTEAGLPNITGYLGTGFNQAQSAGGAFVVREPKTNRKIPTGTDSYQSGIAWDFSAQDSNPIYGNSSTVQPQSIKVYYYIVLATTKRSSAELSIDRMVNQFDNKAENDLSNVTDSANVLMAHNAMPSGRYKELTVNWGSSETTVTTLFTAPADGYVMVTCAYQPNIRGVLSLEILEPNSATTKSLNGIDISDTAAVFQRCTINVSKGDTIRIITANILTSGSDNHMFFIYANGSVSEAS